jgi:peptide subunit release factor 1 (eRF1)
LVAAIKAARAALASAPAAAPVALAEKTLNDAPAGYDNSEASAWASGYNSCLEALAAIAAATAAEPGNLDYHCTLKCAHCGHKNYFTRRELEADPASPQPPISSPVDQAGDKQ